MWNNFNNHPKHGGNRSRRPNSAYRPRGNRGRGGSHHWGNHNSHHQQPLHLQQQQFPLQQLQQPHFGSGNAPHFSAFSDDSFQAPPFMQGGIDFDRSSGYRHHTGRGRDRDREPLFPNRHVNRPKRFLSPPRAPHPPPRPPSPLPGSDEYRQRNIQHTSELIKRQLLGDDSLVEPALNVSSEIGMVEGGVPSVFQRDTIVQQQHPRTISSAEKKKEKSKTRTNRFESESTANRPFDVLEIHQQIVRHISNLSYNKKLNIVNQVGNTAGYDVAILQIQKQKRLELSRALRDLCSSNIAIDPDSDVLNDIIPDIGIKLEDLPREVIEELSSLNAEHQWGNNTDELDFKQSTCDGSRQQFLSDFANVSPPLEDVHMGGVNSCFIDSSIVDPELCFKQAEQLISGFDDETTEFVSTSPYDAGVLYDNGIISEFSQATDELPSVGFNEETPLFCEQVPEIHEAGAIDSFVEQIPELHTCGYETLPTSEIFSDQISDIRDELPCSNVICDFSQPPEQLSFSELPCSELTSVAENTVKLFENDTIPEFEEEVPHIVPLTDKVENFSNDTLLTDGNSTGVIEDLSAIQLPEESSLPIGPPTENEAISNQGASVELSKGIEETTNLLLNSITLSPHINTISTKNKISIVIEKSPKLPPNIFQDDTSRKPTKNSVITSEKIFKKLCSQSSKNKHSTKQDLYCDLPPINKFSKNNAITESNDKFNEIPLPGNGDKESNKNHIKDSTRDTIELKQVCSSPTTNRESKRQNSVQSSPVNRAKSDRKKDKGEFVDIPKPNKSISNSGKSSPLSEVLCLKPDKSSEKNVNDVVKLHKSVSNTSTSSTSIEEHRFRSDKIVAKSVEISEPPTRRTSVPNSDESLLNESIDFKSNSEKPKPQTEGIRLKRNRKIETTPEIKDSPKPRKSDKSIKLCEDSSNKVVRKNETSVDIIDLPKSRKSDNKKDKSNPVNEDLGIRTSTKNEKTVEVHETVPKLSISEQIFDRASTVTEDFSFSSKKKTKKAEKLYNSPKSRLHKKARDLKESRQVLNDLPKSADSRTLKKRLQKSASKAIREEKQFTRQRLFDYINSLPSLTSNISKGQVNANVSSPVHVFNETCRNPENPNYIKNVKKSLLLIEEEAEEGELPKSPVRKAVQKRCLKLFGETEASPNTGTNFEPFDSDIDESEFATNSNEGRLSPMSRRMASAPMNPFADMEPHNQARAGQHTQQPHNAAVVKFSDLKTLTNTLPHGKQQDMSIAKSSNEVVFQELNPNRRYLDAKGHSSDYKSLDEHIESSKVNGNNCANCIHCREKLLKEEKRKARKREQGVQKIKLRRKKLCESSTATAISIDIPVQDEANLAPPAIDTSPKKAWRSPAERKIMPEQNPVTAPKVKLEKRSVYEMEEEQLDYDESLIEEEEKTDNQSSDLRVIPLIEIKEETDPVEQTVSSSILEQIEVFNNSMGKILQQINTVEDASIKNIENENTLVVGPSITHDIQNIANAIIKCNNISVSTKAITTNIGMKDVTVDTGQSALSSANDMGFSNQIISMEQDIKATTKENASRQSEKHTTDENESPRMNKVLILENISVSTNQHLDAAKRILNASNEIISETQIVKPASMNIVKDVGRDHQDEESTLSKLIEKNDKIDTTIAQIETSSEDDRLNKTNENSLSSFTSDVFINKDVTTNQESNLKVTTNEEHVSDNSDITHKTDSKSKIEDNCSEKEGRSTKFSSSSRKHHSSSTVSTSNKKDSTATSFEKSKSSSKSSTKQSNSNNQEKKNEKSSKSSDGKDKDNSSRSRSRSSDPNKSSREHSTSLEPDKKNTHTSKSSHRSTRDSKSGDHKVSGSKDKSVYKKDDGKSSQTKDKSSKSSAYSKSDVSKRDTSKMSIMIQTDEIKCINNNTQTDLRNEQSVSKYVQVGVKTLNKSIETDPKPTTVSVRIQTDDIEIENALSNLTKGKSKKNVLAQMRDIDKEIERLLKLKSDLYRKADIYSDESEDDIRNDMKGSKSDIYDDTVKKSKRRGPKRKGDPIKNEIKIKTRRLRSQDNDDEDNNALKDMLESTLRDIVDPISKENEISLHHSRTKPLKNNVHPVDKKEGDEYMAQNILDSATEPMERTDPIRGEYIQNLGSTSHGAHSEASTISNEVVMPISKRRESNLRHHEVNTRNRKLKSLADALTEIDQCTIAKDENTLQKIVDSSNKDIDGILKSTKKTRCPKLTTQESFHNDSNLEDNSTFANEMFESREPLINEPLNKDTYNLKSKVNNSNDDCKELNSRNIPNNILEDKKLIQREIIPAINETEYLIEADVPAKPDKLSICSKSNINESENESRSTKANLIHECEEANTVPLSNEASEDPIGEVMEDQSTTVNIMDKDNHKPLFDSSSTKNILEIENQNTSIQTLGESEDSIKETTDPKSVFDNDVHKDKNVANLCSPMKYIWQNTIQEISSAVNKKNKTDIDESESTIHNAMVRSNICNEPKLPQPTVDPEVTADTSNVETVVESSYVQSSIEPENEFKSTRPKRLPTRKCNELPKEDVRVDAEDVITQSRMARRIAHKNAEAVKIVEQRRKLRVQRKPLHKYINQPVVETVSVQNAITTDLNKNSAVEIVSKCTESVVVVQINTEHKLTNNERVGIRPSDDHDETNVRTEGNNISLAVDATDHHHDKDTNLLHKDVTNTTNETQCDTVDGVVLHRNKEVMPQKFKVQIQDVISLNIPTANDNQDIPTDSKTRNRRILEPVRKRRRQVSDSSTSTTSTTEVVRRSSRSGRRKADQQENRVIDDKSAPINNQIVVMGEFDTALLTRNNESIINHNISQIGTEASTETQVTAINANDAILPIQSGDSEKDTERQRRSASITSLCPSDGLENLMEVAYEEPIMHSEDSTSDCRGPKRKRQRKGKLRSESRTRMLSISVTDTIDRVARNIPTNIDLVELSKSITKDISSLRASDIPVQLKKSVVHVVRYSLSELLTMKAALCKPLTEDTEDTEATETSEPYLTSELLTSHLDIKCEPRSVDSHRSDHDPVLDDEQPPSIDDSRLTVPYLQEDLLTPVEMPNLQESIEISHEGKDRKSGLAGMDVDMLEEITTNIINDYESQMGAYVPELTNFRIDLPRDGPDDEPSTIIDRETFGGCVGPIIAVRAIDSYVLGSSDRGTLYIYDLATSKLLYVVDIASKALTALCVVRPPGRPSENRPESTGPLLYTGALDRTVAVVDYKNGIVKQRVPCNEPVQCMEYKWGFVFMGTYNGSLRRLNIKTNDIEDSVNIAKSTVLQLKASQEGARRVLLVATRHQAVSVRDAMTGLLLRTMDTTLNPTVYTLLCDRSSVYCGTSKHDVLIYSFQDGQLIHKLEESNGSGVVCLTRYKKLLFTGCYNGNIYAYKLPSNQYVGVIPGPGGLLLSMDILDDKIAVSTRLNFKSIDIPDSILAHGS